MIKSNKEFLYKTVIIGGRERRTFIQTIERVVGNLMTVSFKLKKIRLDCPFVQNLHRF